MSAQELVDKFFAENDKDGSGTLNRAEARELVKTFFSADGKDVSEEQITAGFDIVDANADGTITKEELTKVFAMFV